MAGFKKRKHERKRKQNLERSVEKLPWGAGGSMGRLNRFILLAVLRLRLFCFVFVFFFCLFVAVVVVVVCVCVFLHVLSRSSSYCSIR